jgi:ABC-type multidrug transport system fused ATPase/permease subunit
MLRYIFEKLFADFLRVYRVLPRRLRHATLGVLALSGILAVTELLTIFSIAFLMMSIAAPERLLALKPVVVLFHFFPWLERLSADMRLFALVVSSAVLGFIIAKNAFAALATTSARRLEAEVALFAGESIFKQYLYSPYVIHLIGSSPKMLQALSWRTQLGALFGTLIMTYVYAAVALLMLTALTIATPGAVLLVITAIAAIATGVYRAFRGKVDMLGKNVAEYTRKANRCAMSATHGIRETLIYRQQETFLTTFHQTCRNAVPKQASLAVAPSMPAWILESVGFMVIPCAIWIMYVLLDASMPRITAVLTIIILVAWRLLPTLNRLLAALVTARGLRHSALDCLTQVEEALAAPMSVSPAPDPNFALREGIRLMRVSFRYPKSESNCLSDIDCFIPCGSRLGVIGQSGAGKSTLALILSGLAQPNDGAMQVDGKELTPEALAAYCLRVGYVPQNPYLMPGTLAENVAFSQWGKPWDEEKVRLACRMAELDVAETRGLDLPIGENGAGLSGGQAQRLAIARALYVSPSILILDEATSALDSGVENAIMDTIFALPQSITTIIIAHRLSTVERCDTLLWLEEGRLVASGPPDELLPRYQEYLNKIRE